MPAITITRPRSPPTGTREVYRGYISSQPDHHARPRADTVPAGYTGPPEAILKSGHHCLSLPGTKRTRTRAISIPLAAARTTRRGDARPASSGLASPLGITDRDCLQGELMPPVRAHGIGIYRLGPVAVPGITAIAARGVVLTVAEMIIQLALERALDDHLGQPVGFQNSATSLDLGSMRSAHTR